jgi:hypothetical protein
MKFRGRNAHPNRVEKTATTRGWQAKPPADRPDFHEISRAEGPLQQATQFPKAAQPGFVVPTQINFFSR